MPVTNDTPTEYQDSITGGLLALKGNLITAITTTDRLIERSIAETPKPKEPVKETPKNGPVKLIGILLAVGLAFGANHLPEVKPMTRDMHGAKLEIELAGQADMLAKAGDFSGVFKVATEMNKNGLLAAGAYWEGIAYFNLAEPEKAAQSFIRSAEHGHPQGLLALAKVRSGT